MTRRVRFCAGFTLSAVLCGFFICGWMPGMMATLVLILLFVCWCAGKWAVGSRLTARWSLRRYLSFNS